MSAQHPVTQADYKKTVINLSSIPLEDAAYSALSNFFLLIPDDGGSTYL
jgi:hypothetical protein